MPTSSTQPLPRPDYLKDTTTAFQNARTREIRAATNIFESGRLSLVPCGWCIKYNEACIVAPDVSGRCMSCSFKSKKTYECLAEGVKGGTSTSGTSSQVTTSVSVVLPIGGILPHRSSYSAIPPPATQANASQTAIPSFVPVNAGSSSHESTNPSGRRVPSKLKRKRTVSDPADAIETGAKRTRGHTDATMTESSYVYGPTNPNLASRAPAPAPISPTSGSVAYDLAMRNENPARWAKWAVELQEEVHNLRHVPDLGSGTMAIIRMMKKDGVWPTEKDGVLELHHEHDE